MPVLHYQVETQAHQKLVVTLRGASARVLVLDEENFRRYQAGEYCWYAGGHYDTSPVIVEPPEAGRWHMAVEFSTDLAMAEISVQVI